MLLAVAMVVARAVAGAVARIVIIASSPLFVSLIAGRDSLGGPLLELRVGVMPRVMLPEPMFQMLLLRPK